MFSRLIQHFAWKRNTDTDSSHRINFILGKRKLPTKTLIKIYLLETNFYFILFI